MVEKFIYNLVKKNRYLKDFLKFFYQLFFLPASYLNRKIKGDFEVVAEQDGYFGFHDRPSLNEDGYLISHINLELDFVSILVTDLQSEVIASVETNCFNFQQGSLATWFNKKSIIYNYNLDGSPQTRIFNVQTSSVEKVLPFNFFSVSSNCQYVTSINFLRFASGLPGYGYDVPYDKHHISDSKESLPDAGVSDIIIYDVETCVEIKRFSISELVPLSTGLISDGYHYFSHSSFSPDNSKVYFLLRSSNQFKNTSQLFVYIISEDRLVVLPTGSMVSHLCWLNENNIAAYCNVLSNNIPISDRYYIFDVSNQGNITSLNCVANDGHPCLIKDGFMLTDTYADRYRRQHLYYIELRSDSVLRSMSFFSPFKFRGLERVDLHPRLSACGRYVTVDTSYSGHRKQLVIKL